MIDPYVVQENRNDAWCRWYFSGFLTAMAKGLGPGHSMDFRRVFDSFLHQGDSAYHQREIGPTTLAPLILLMRFGQSLMDFDIESKIKRHALIVICKAVESELQTDETQLTLRAYHAATLGVLYNPLMPMWKEHINYAYHSYREPLIRLKSGSTHYKLWENAIRDIFPLLYLYKFVPTHIIKFAERPIIPDLDSYGNTPSAYSNIIREPQPFYMRVFGSAEIQAHLDETKIIDEVYAHLTATIGMIALRGSEQYLNDVRTEVLEIAKTKGRLAAQQSLIRRNVHDLSIPKCFADELAVELRTLEI